MTSHGPRFAFLLAMLCALGERARPTAEGEVVVHVGSARGLPGETLDIPVTIDPNGLSVTGIEIDLPSDDFRLQGCWTAHEDGVRDLGPAAISLPGLYRLSVNSLRVQTEHSSLPQKARATAGEILVLPPS